MSMQSSTLTSRQLSATVHGMTRPTSDKRSAPKRIPWEVIEGLLKKGYEPRDIALRLGCSTQNVYERIARHRKPNGKGAA